MVHYNIVLKDPSGNMWDFERSTDIAWERYENEVGRCMFILPYTDSKLVEALADDEQFMEILIYREGDLVWQGFVAFILDKLDTAAIYGLDYKEILKWYRCSYNTKYTTQKIGSQIISPEWDTIAARTNIALGDLITKGTIEDPYQSGTSTAKTVTKTVFEEDFFTLVYELMALSRAGSPSGAWTQNTVFDVSLSETAPTFTFKRDVGVERPDVVFEMNSEIIDVYMPKDYRYIRNDVKGWSVIEGPDVINDTQTDATSITNYYRRELSPVFGALTTSSELTEKTKDFLKENKDPSKNVSFSFAAGLIPFDGYNMGDDVQIRINRGRLDIKEYRRVVGMEVEVDNSGEETAKPVLRKKRT